MCVCVCVYVYVCVCVCVCVYVCVHEHNVQKVLIKRNTYLSEEQFPQNIEKVDIHVHVYTCFNERYERRKEEASKVKQTNKQTNNNTVHPRQSHVYTCTTGHTVHAY